MFGGRQYSLYSRFSFCFVLSWPLLVCLLRLSKRWARNFLSSSRILDYNKNTSLFDNEEWQPLLSLEHNQKKFWWDFQMLLCQSTLYLLCLHFFLSWISPSKIWDRIWKNDCSRWPSYTSTGTILDNRYALRFDLTRYD